ncbi:MAG: hypothetical protein ACJASR_002049 [Psychroserpens sp.]
MRHQDFGLLSCNEIITDTVLHHMTKSIYIIFLIVTVLLISCSKEVYEFDNGLRKSTFILKNSKFKYIEESNIETFKSTGTFSRNDTSIVFNFKKSKRLPFSNASRQIEIISKVEDNQFQEITVLNTADGFTEFDANVILRDRKLNKLEILKTDFDGKVQIKNPNKIFEIEIVPNIGLSKAIFIYEPYKEKNILVKLIPIVFGGEPIETPCLSVLIEPIIKCNAITKNNETVAIELNTFRYDRAK